MCVDLTSLNKGVRWEVYPFPRVSDMLSQLAEGRVFSKLDANSGFWQVRLDPNSKLLTTFITPGVATVFVECLLVFLQHLNSIREL